MVQQIPRFSVIQTAKVFGVVSVIMVLLQIMLFQVPMSSANDFPFKISPLLLWVVSVIAVFILPAIVCVIYNWVAGKIGGIELRLDGQRIGRVSIVQTARVIGVMYGLLGISLGLLVIVMPVPPPPGFAPFSGKDNLFVVGVFGVFAVLFGVLGFIWAVVSCALYNLVARMIGGIELGFDDEMDGQRIRRFSIFQTAKVLGVVYGMLGLFTTIISVIAKAISKEAGFPTGFDLLFPIVFAIGGFIVIAIGIAIYNGVAHIIGGIKIQFEGRATLV